MTEDEIERVIQEDLRSFRKLFAEPDSENLSDMRRNVHPNIDGLPDYGIADLSPETEERCRTLCERHGVAYEGLKARIAASHQVIQPRREGTLTVALTGKRVWPINFLDSNFRAAVQGAIWVQSRIERERASRLRTKLTGRNMDGCATEITASTATS